MNEQIDWSKAPHGATHYYPATCASCVPLWLLIEKGRFLSVGYMDSKDWALHYATSQPELDMTFAVARPKQWNGPEDGLPPVGLEVEVEHQGKWIKCEVIAHFENENAPVAVFTFSPYPDKPKVKESAYYIRHAFRPIRTAEQLAAEERSKACDQMYGVILSLPENRSNNRSDICEALYDAGYRKVEQP